MKINPELLPKPIITTDSNGWKKVDFGSYQEYYRNFALSRNFGSNTWGWISLGVYANLPTGISKFDSTKMTFSASCYVGDGAIKVTLGINNNNTQITGTWQNHYNSSVTANLVANFILRVYN